MEKLIQLINENSAKTGNLSGISVNQLAHRSGFSTKKTYRLLTKIIQEGKASSREGINQDLVFAL